MIALDSRRLARRLNRALHEARRPLQLLALAPNPPTEVSQIAAALAEVEAIVNGSSPSSSSPEPTPVGRLTAETVSRFQATPLAAGRSITVADASDGAAPTLDRAAVTSAIENLVANALEHGRGPIEISVLAVGDGATLTVRNATGGSTETTGSDPRRGHGLGLIAQAAVNSGGQFTFRNDGDEAVAMLALGWGNAALAAQ